MTPPQAAYQVICLRVDLFDKYVNAYKKENQNETETRAKFIAPFFKTPSYF
jgi:hypothetical protein